MRQAKKNIKQKNMKSKNKKVDNNNIKTKNKKEHPTTILTIKNKDIEDNKTRKKTNNNASKKRIKNDSPNIKRHLDIDEEPPKRKHRLLKFLFKMLFIIIILGVAFLSYKAYIFKLLAKEMFNNSPSNIYDTNRNLIAQIGYERHRENVDFSSIPSDLVHAYVSIEDQRFYTHYGVDIKRTGAAILSYIQNRRFLYIWWQYNYTAISKKFDR